MTDANLLRRQPSFHYRNNSIKAENRYSLRYQIEVRDVEAGTVTRPRPAPISLRAKSTRDGQGVNSGIFGTISYITPIFSTLLLTFTLSIFTIFFMRMRQRGLSMLCIRYDREKSLRPR
jgi:hypothetical protein